VVTLATVSPYGSLVRWVLTALPKGALGDKVVMNKLTKDNLVTR
jgi:hypothetical protein